MSGVDDRVHPRVSLRLLSIDPRRKDEYMKHFNKENMAIAAGTALVVGILGLALAPAAFAAPGEDSATPARSASPLVPQCVTFDQMIAEQYKLMQRPGMTFGVLGADGGFAETSPTPGAEYIKGVNKIIADWETEKAQKIAKGASCIGFVQ